MERMNRRIIRIFQVESNKKKKNTVRNTGLPQNFAVFPAKKYDLCLSSSYTCTKLHMRGSVFSQLLKVIYLSGIVIVKWNQENLSNEVKERGYS